MLPIEIYIVTAIQMFLLSLFICLIYKKNHKINFLNCIGFTLLQILSFFIYYNVIIPRFITANIQMFFYVPIMALSLLLILIGFFQARSFEKQFHVNLFIALSQYAMYIIGTVVTYLVDSLFSMFAGGSFFSSVLIHGLFIAFIIGVTVFISYQHFAKIIDTPFLENKKTNMLLYISIFIMIYIFYLLYEYNRGDLKMTFLTIAIIGLCIGTLKLLEHTNAITKKEYEARLHNQELQHQKTTYQKVERSIETLSKTRHDMIYVLTHIKNLNQNAQYEQIQDFIFSQIEQLEKIHKPILTGNSTLDYVLYEFMHEIQRVNAHLTCNYFEGETPMTNVVNYAIVGEMLDIALSYNQNHDNPELIIQHGLTHDKYYTKIKFSLDKEVDPKDFEHLQKILSQYQYSFMENKDVNLYEIGFLTQ